MRDKISEIAADSSVMYFEQDGQPSVAAYTFYRGDYANFYPSDVSLDNPEFVARYYMQGLLPQAPFIDAGCKVVAFGSCFAAFISRHLITSASTW